MRWVEELQRRKRETERRLNDLRDDARELTTRGREFVRTAIQTGQTVLGQAPSQVQQLARTIRSTPGPASASRPTTQVRPSPKAVRPSAVASKPAQQELARAALSGAVDEFTFGAADRVLSAGDALLSGGLAGFGDRYQANMAEKRAQDAYDSQNYGAARLTGQAAGLALGIAATGGAGAAAKTALTTVPKGLKLANAIAKAPKLGGVDPRGLAQFAAGSGALAGLGVQGAEDLASRRLSGRGRYVGAALGGAAGGLVTLGRGPMVGGALGGAAESIVGDLAEGRAPAAGRAISAAHGGAVLGGIGGVAGTYGTALRSNQTKGAIGEALSYGKTVSRGKIPNVKKEAVPVGGGRSSKPDQVIDEGYLEAKMGPGADLTPNQRKLRKKAEAEGKEFIIDAWTFRDAGKGAGIIAAPVGAVRVGEDRAP